MELSTKKLAHNPDLPRHRHDSTVLCRFVEGNFEAVDMDFRHVEYIAFSHVWGDPSSYSLTSIKNIPQPIIATPSKARFLEARLETLVGDGYFWLDVVCIDQDTTPEAADERIQATAVMPDIYSHATKTIVIRDGFGFQPCCAEAMGDFETWEQYDIGWQIWGEHWRHKHLGKLLYEGVLERLWPLQESVLSNRIQFVACKTQLQDIDVSFDNSHLTTQWLEAHIDRLWVTSRAWASYGSSRTFSEDEQLAFIKAILNNGEIERSQRMRYNNSIGSEFLIQSNSTRKTTKSRDLILSTMSQYDWYNPPSPQEIRKMTFGELFRNCFEQARRAGSATLPKITAGMVGEAGSKLETSLVPEPQYLGDLVKLFGLATDSAPQNDQDCALGFNLGAIGVRGTEFADAKAALKIIESSFEFSPVTWRHAKRGELGVSDATIELDRHLFSEAVSEEVCEEQALRLLNIILVGHFNGGSAMFDAESCKRDLIRANPNNYVRVLIRIAALVSSGIGVSALTWSKKLWRPVLIQIGKREVLGIISSAELKKRRLQGKGFHHAAPADSTLRFTYHHTVITRAGEGFKAKHRCVGLVPAFYNVEEDEETVMSRISELGFQFQTKVAFPLVNLT